MFYYSISKIKYKYKNKELEKILGHKIQRVIDSVCVSQLGRVEAIEVSPSCDMIAYASFDLNQIVIFNIKKINKEIWIEDYQILECDLQEPHDLSWIDNSKIVIACRGGPAIICEIDKKSKKSKIILKLKEKIFNKTNAVCVQKKQNGFKLFFCNIFHYVSYIFFDNNFKVIEKGIQINKKLRVPDGIAINESKTKMAVTSALTDEIIVYNLENMKEFINLKSPRPHAVEFLKDDLLISTGGGEPYLHFWKLKEKTHFKIVALDKNQFELRGSDFEGGIKGVSFSKNLNLIFATCPNAPFEIFNLY